MSVSLYSVGAAPMTMLQAAWLFLVAHEQSCAACVCCYMGAAPTNVLARRAQDVFMHDRARA